MKVVLGIRAAIYFILGLMVVIFNQYVLDYLNLLVGVVMIVSALEEILFKLLSKSHKRYNNTMYMPLSSLIFGILIVCKGKDSLEFVCILWACVAILEAMKTLNMYVSLRKFSIRSIIFTIKSIASIVLAILLLINPEGHVLFHLILLGVEIMLEGISLCLQIILYSEEELLEEIRKKTLNLT